MSERSVERAPASAAPERERSAPPIVRAALAATGAPLEASTRAFFERRLGADLSDVRIHRDVTAAASARSVGALAYTVGSDVVFAAGQYAPGTDEGRRLIAHELAHVLQQRATGEPLLQRAPVPPEGETAPAGAEVQAAPGAYVLESPHPDVNQRSVEQVGTDLRGRLDFFTDAVPIMRSSSELTQKLERDWYAKRNLWASLVEVFNPEQDTDPARWDAVLGHWDAAAEALGLALAIPLTPGRINEAGQRAKDALGMFEVAANVAEREEQAYERYLLGFQHAAGQIYTYTSFSRDLLFCAAVGLAVVAFAPVVVGALGTAGVGLGLAEGSLGLAAFQTGGTVVAMGGLGAAIESSGYALTELSAQAAAALFDLLQGSSNAADEFDLSAVRAGFWEGFRHGFVDGILALAGLQAEKLVASYASQAVRSWLGPGNCTLYAILLRRTLTRAISGGATGSVIGALQAGYRAAAQGRDLAGITAAMENGFAIGLAGGTVLGGAGGAWEARGAHELQQRVAARLHEVVAATVKGGQPATMADDVLVQKTLDKLRANPTAGTNQEILELTPQVWQALHDPDTLSAALAEVWLEEHLLGLLAPQAAAERYGAAAMALAGRRGAPVVVLPPGPPIDEADFIAQVVLPGNRFLDLNILSFSPTHGATTHLIQDMAVDRALFGTGIRSDQYRALLKGAVGPEGPMGGDLWVYMFDPFGSINDPNVLWPAMREALEIP